MTGVKKMKAHEVIIDGVRYAPVSDCNPSMDAITRGLLYSFWGELSNDMTLARAMDGITVRVYDDGEGEPIEKVIADIARRLKHD